MDYMQHASLVLPSIASVVAAFALILARSFFFKPRQPHAFPPGPRSVPFVGNLFDMDWNQPWVTFADWSKIHGDLVHSKLFGLRIVTLHSEDLIRDLFDKRSNKYSDRVALATVAPYGADFSTPTIRYGDAWRFHRRLYHHIFRAESATVFRPTQTRKAHELLTQLLERPSGFHSHMHRFGAAVVMSATYDYDVTPHDSTLDMVQAAVERMISSPEKATFVDTFPFLKYIPAWFPGIGYFNAKECREACWKMKMEPYQDMLARIGMDNENMCMAAECIRRFAAEKEYNDLSVEKMIIDACGTSFAAGSDTTASVLIVFALAMVLFPNVQEQAQKEVIRVIGEDKLPTYDDRDSLPIVDAVLREALRWFPVTPLAVWHATSEDDIYNGYYIPKGTAIVANVWALSRDPIKYPSPEDFNPWRFFKGDGELNDDKFLHPFGYGRRICPGVHLADASMWIAIASMLTVFKFSKAKDVRGVEIEPKPTWTSGVVVAPHSFPCSITPRNSCLDQERLKDMIEIAEH